MGGQVEQGISNIEVFLPLEILLVPVHYSIFSFKDFHLNPRILEPLTTYYH